ncbi:MAG: HEAT repeat domain-containing protein [Thermoanaerobaculia bacterium]|nr:HEAT repeat domain-containing protein [Thermoanaerobaculia bacterium]
MRRVFSLLALACFLVYAQPARAEVDDKERKKQEKKLLKGDAEDRRSAASFFWSNANEGSVPALIDALHDSDAYVRSSVAGSLWKLGEKARPAEAALKQALSDSSARVRLKAAGALGVLGTPPERMADAVAIGLEDRDVDVRADTAHFLKRAGAPAVQFLPALLGCVRESQKRKQGVDSSRLSETQSQCRKDLREIGILPKEAMPILDEALKDGDKEERRAAADVLGKAGGAARVEIPALIKALKDPERDVRWEAADSLGELGNAAKEAIPALTEVIRSDREVDVRKRALRSLEDIDKEVKLSVGALILAMKDADKEIRSDAVARFQYLDVVPKEAIGPLREALKDPDTATTADRALKKPVSK